MWRSVLRSVVGGSHSEGMLRSWINGRSLASYVAGKFVLDRTRAGVPVGEALEQARAAVERTLGKQER